MPHDRLTNFQVINTTGIPSCAFPYNKSRDMRVYETRLVQRIPLAKPHLRPPAKQQVS